MTYRTLLPIAFALLATSPLFAHWETTLPDLSLGQAGAGAVADPNALDVNGETALHRASEWGHDQVATLLRGYGATMVGLTPQPLTG